MPVGNVDTAIPQKSPGGAPQIAAASAMSAATMEGHAAWPMIARLPVLLAVSIPLNGFRVCDLLNLAKGQTIGSMWATTEDVPLKAGGRQIGWGEFEVVEERKALRLTSLA